LFDSDFVLERPKRLYRAGLNKITAPFEHRHEKEDAFAKAQNGGELEKTALNTDSGKDIHRLAVAQDPSAATGVRDDDPDELAQVSQHTFYVRNSERKLKLVARTERQMEQFIASIERMAEKSVWAGPNRFDSFAPIRMNVSAQWLVDGVCQLLLPAHVAHTSAQRDYYWRLSEAVSLAKKVIYIVSFPGAAALG
jgi:phospholipase D1/2